MTRPLWLRLWHWTNATLIILLSASGVSLHYATPGAMLIPFSLAREIHNVCGIALCAAYPFFVIANLVSGRWVKYVPLPGRFFARAWAQGRYYAWDYFFVPRHKDSEDFNALQQIVYWIVMYLLLPALLTTGVVFLLPELAPDQLFGVDGLLPVAVAHYVVAFGVFVFLVSHAYLATMGETATSLLHSMIKGRR